MCCGKHSIGAIVVIVLIFIGCISFISCSDHLDNRFKLQIASVSVTGEEGLSRLVAGSKDNIEIQSARANGRREYIIVTIVVSNSSVDSLAFDYTIPYLDCDGTVRAAVLNGASSVPALEAKDIDTLNLVFPVEDASKASRFVLPGHMEMDLRGDPRFDRPEYLVAAGEIWQVDHPNQLNDEYDDWTVDDSWLVSASEAKVVADRQAQIWFPKAALISIDQKNLILRLTPETRMDNDGFEKPIKGSTRSWLLTYKGWLDEVLFVTVGARGIMDKGTMRSSEDVLRGWPAIDDWRLEPERLKKDLDGSVGSRHYTLLKLSDGKTAWRKFGQELQFKYYYPSGSEQVWVDYEHLYDAYTGERLEGYDLDLERPRVFDGLSYSFIVSGD